MPNVIKISTNKVFKPVHQAKHRYIVMKGSAGSGKSVDTAQQYIIRLLSEPGRNLLCVRKIEQANEKSTYVELLGAIHRAGLSNMFSSTVRPLSIKCKVNGNEIIFAGVNDTSQREKLKSINVAHGKLTDCWVEEATELLQSDFDIIDDRFRGVLPEGQFYQIKMTFNPVSSAHWIKRVFFDTPDSNVLTHHSTYLDNRFIDEAYYKRMERRKLLDPEGYRIYGLGEWGETSGLVFTNWHVDEISQRIEDYDDVAIGQDFGFNHANALLLLGIKDNQIFILRELYVTEKDTNEIIKLADNWIPIPEPKINEVAIRNGDILPPKLFNPKSIIMFCDSAEPDRILMWNRAGYYATPCEKGAGSVKAQIDWLKQRQIIVDTSCTNTIAELQQYRWKKDKTTGLYTDEPVNFLDDAMAALRYGTQNWRQQGEVIVKNPETKTPIQIDREQLERKNKRNRRLW